MIDTPKSIASFHQNPNVRHFEDPSEPIYTDPSLFERSRSLRSIAVLQEENLSKDV